MAANMAKDSPAQSLDRIMVRLPDGMRDMIAEAASRNGRSMNAEVVARLQASFGHIDAPFTEQQEKVVHEMLKEYLAEDRASVEARLDEMEKRMWEDVEARLAKMRPR